MANDSYTQTALANDTYFRKRVSTAMSSVAWQITNEDPATPNHSQRVAYARQVIRNLSAEVNTIMPSFVMRPNVNNFPTTYEFDWVLAAGFVASAASDADLQSQLFTDWDVMAGGAGYAPAGVMMPPFIPQTPQ